MNGVREAAPRMASLGGTSGRRGTELQEPQVRPTAL
jgi:hypothetical protein